MIDRGPGNVITLPDLVAIIVNILYLKSNYITMDCAITHYQSFEGTCGVHLQGGIMIIKVTDVKTFSTSSEWTDYLLLYLEDGARRYCCSCLVCILIVVLCVLLSSYVYLLYYVCIVVFPLDVGLLARSQYSEGPATGHLETGFSWFPCVYKQMLRRFPKFQVATTCFSCSPPDLNLVVTDFMFCLHVK